jgi:hypothetical protein
MGSRIQGSGYRAHQYPLRSDSGKYLYGVVLMAPMQCTWGARCESGATCHFRCRLCVECFFELLDLYASQCKRWTVHCWLTCCRPRQATGNTCDVLMLSFGFIVGFFVCLPATSSARYGGLLFYFISCPTLPSPLRFINFGRTQTIQMCKQEVKRKFGVFRCIQTWFDATLHYKCNYLLIYGFRLWCQISQVVKIHGVLTSKGAKWTCLPKIPTYLNQLDPQVGILGHICTSVSVHTPHNGRKLRTG